uniref:Uncharacterized protein n=1 Tax=Leersia perrieri TaxID=77586 RepID=A0A0D9XZI6_9ORYZ
MDSQVQVVETCLVTPSEDSPRKALALSPLDLLLANRGHTPTVYFYPRTAGAVSGDGGFFDVERLKASMARALVAFYPLAGRLAMDDDDGQLRIDCNGEGALLVVARHDGLAVDDFDGFGPSPELRRLFVPRVEPPSIIMAIQPSSSPDHPVVVSEVLVLSADHVSNLKHACGDVSTFAAVTAHVWRCLCVTRRLPPNAKTRLTFPASIHRSIRPKISNHYFGNAIIWLGTAGLVCDIVAPDDDTLAVVAGCVTGAVRRMDDEVARSAIDYFEIMREKYGHLLPSPPSDVAETDLRVVSWLGMPVYDVDFGWGTPRQMLRAESERGGFVYLMNGGPGDGGGLRTVVCMKAANLVEFKRLLF